jgi:tetratricopeptide (TPR) repeat protein
MSIRRWAAALLISSLFVADSRAGQDNADYVVPPAASALHNQGREAGAKGQYDLAIDLLTRAAALAPGWPYPIYDRAYTHLLMKDSAAALADYERVETMDPRGFFTAPTAVDILRREQKGEFPPGLYLAYTMLETVSDKVRRRSLVQQFVEKYPRFAPGWYRYQLQTFVETPDDRLQAIENGLRANPDRETRGMLELNKATTLDHLGKREESMQLLRRLAADSQSTRGVQALAKGLMNGDFK